MMPPPPPISIIVATQQSSSSDGSLGVVVCCLMMLGLLLMFVVSWINEHFICSDLLTALTFGKPFEYIGVLGVVCRIMIWAMVAGVLLVIVVAVTSLFGW